MRVLPPIAEMERDYLLTGVNSLPLRQYWVTGSYTLIVPCAFILSLGYFR